jgi:hypothetical protein
MFLKNILIAFVFIFNISFAFSQVNIESVRDTAKKDQTFWGETKGGLEIQKGNVNIFSYDLDVLTHLQKETHHIFLQGKTSQGKQENKKFKNASFAHLRWTWMPTKILGAEIFTQIQHDEFKSLEIRQLNGIGLRSELFHFDSFIMSLGSGAMTDFEKLTSGNESTNIRSTSYLSLAKTFNNDKKNLILLTVYYQPLFNNPEDYRVNLEANVRTNLISSWNVSIDNSINYMYDTNPPESVQTNDLVLKASVVYEW